MKVFFAHRIAQAGKAYSLSGTSAHGRGRVGDKARHPVRAVLDGEGDTSQSPEKTGPAHGGPCVAQGQGRGASTGRKAAFAARQSPACLWAVAGTLRVTSWPAGFADGFPGPRKRIDAPRCGLVLGWVLVLLVLCGCAASGGPNPTAVRNSAWPENTLSDMRYHVFRPMKSAAAALQALRDLGPGLQAVIAGTGQGYVHRVDADPQRVVLGWRWWEEKPIWTNRPGQPFCPPGSPSITCDDAWLPGTVPFRRVRRSAQGAVLYRDIRAIRLRRGPEVTVLQTQGADMVLRAQERSTADMVADAFYTLAASAGVHLKQPSGVELVDLTAHQKRVLRLGHGVQVVGIMPGSPAARAGLQHLDVVLRANGQTVNARTLSRLLRSPGRVTFSGLRYPLQASAGAMTPQPFSLTVIRPANRP